MKKLTERQQNVLDVIARLSMALGKSPTYRELAAELNVTSKCVVDHIAALERKGAIIKAGKNKARAIVIVGYCPCCGREYD